MFNISMHPLKGDFSMGQAPQTLDGWFALHDFRSIDWKAWKAVSQEEKSKIIDELLQVTRRFAEVNSQRTGSYGQFGIVGHKADLLFLHMRPTVEELEQVKTELNKTAFADFLTAPYSYLSVVELGGYMAKPDVDPETDPYLVSRLKPEMPPMKNICFYPMNKRRVGNDNWFMLPPEERHSLLRDHGNIGRKYADKVKQIITGSMGLDDWEWGVTLFSDEPLQFKKLIYEMRYDESSARFAEFGPFLIGNRLSEERLAELLQV
jgi:chlorite dismutase